MNLPQHKLRDGHGGRRPFLGPPNTRASGLEFLIALVPSRFLRSGPRTIAHLTACVAFVILIIKILSLSESTIVRQKTLATTPSKTWVWTTEVEVATGEISRISTTKDDSSSQKGLRIVVFGQDDAATPGRTSTTIWGATTRMPAWTDIMCDELNCASLLSFVPLVDSPTPQTHCLTSNDIYLSAIESSLNRSESWDPSGDYTFQPNLFPVPYFLPDLSRQVDFFLSLHPSLHALKETIYIFSLGTWDVYSLATLPLHLSKHVVNSLVGHVFAQAERLYQNVASSSYSSSSSPQSRVKVLFPALLDPTVLPAWSSSPDNPTVRPTVPGTTSPEIQLRNAAVLTAHWNALVASRLRAWVLQPEIVSTTGGSSTNTDATSNQNHITPETSQSGTDTDQTFPAADDKNKPTATDDNNDDANPTAAAASESKTRRREAYLFQLNEYVLDAMRDHALNKQLDGPGPQSEPINNHRTSRPSFPPRTTSKGLGGRFTFVRGTCLRAAAAAAAPTLGKDQVKTNQKSQEKNKEQNHNEQKEEQETSTMSTCDEPDDYLFWSSFKLGARAIKGLGRQAAEMVRDERTVRD